MADEAAQARYGAEVRAEVCERLESGESLNSICGDPRMPTGATIHYWAKRDPEFAAAKRRAQRSAWRRQRREDAEAQAARMTRLALSPPSRQGRPSGYTPELADAICRRIAHGEGIAAICRDAAMPCVVTVYAWLRQKSEFADMYALAREMQAHTKFDLAWEIACAATPGSVEVARLQVGVIRWQASRLAPRKYGERLEDVEKAPVTVRIRKWGENGWADLEAPGEARGEGPWD